METEQNYNEFISQVVDKYEAVVQNIASKLPGFPRGGNARPIDQALLDGTMKQTLQNSVTGITELMNNVGALKSKITDNASRGAASMLNKRLVTWANITNKKIRELESWEQNEGKKYKGKTLVKEDWMRINGFDILQYVSQAARDVKHEMVVLGYYMRGEPVGNAVDVNIPRNLK